MDNRKRCKWCNMKNPLYIKYHDEEWCKPNFDEKYLYEMLILESFQAGLSWECVLNKRQAFEIAYDKFGSFDNYLKTFTEGKTYYEIDKTTSPLSDAISKDLKKRGMKFVGSTIIYSYLQAIGVIISHDKDCFFAK